MKQHFNTITTNNWFSKKFWKFLDKIPISNFKLLIRFQHLRRNMEMDCSNLQLYTAVILLNGILRAAYKRTSYKRSVGQEIVKHGCAAENWKYSIISVYDERFLWRICTTWDFKKSPVFFHLAVFPICLHIFWKSWNFRLANLSKWTCPKKSGDFVLRIIWRRTRSRKEKNKIISINTFCTISRYFF